MTKQNNIGMSTVLATVIILAITVAMGALVWGIISNLIGENLEESQSCFGVLDQVKLNNDYTCYNSTSKKVQFSVNVGDIDIDAILVSISFEGSSDSATLTGNYQTLSNIKYYPDEKCVGTATPCGQFLTSGTCGAQAGCFWNPGGNICTATVTPCLSITTQQSCQTQLGCTWGGVKMPNKNSGVTYFFEGITSSPTAVSIIPIINDNQCGSADTISRLDDCAALLS